MATSEQDPRQLYVRRELSAFRLADGTSIALPRGPDLPALVPDGAVTLLRQCAGFDTIDGHAARIAQKLELPESAREAIATDLQRFAQRRWLLSWDAVARVGSEAPSVPPITALAILTRNRPSALARCLASHLDHLQAFGRRLDVSVMDSSTDAHAENATRAMAAAAFRRAGGQRQGRLRYASQRDKAAFAERLAHAAEVPVALARFALQDTHGCGHDAGSNRNALLLGHAGRLFLSSDDDVICEPRSVGDPVAPLCLTSESDPTGVTLFESLEHGRRATRAMSGCILDAHEALLGRDGASLLAGRGPADVVLESAQPALVEAVAAGVARVAVTSSGLLGDSGARYPAFFAWTNARARAQLAERSHDEYRCLLESRQILRVVGAATVTKGSFVMSTHIAIDHRALLPPFFPAFRGQDLTFGRMLRLFGDAHLIGHLPCAILHVPIETRKGSLDDLWPRGNPSFASVLDACLRRAGSATAHAVAGEARLLLLGRQLRELASLDPRELSHVVRLQLVEECAPRLASWTEEIGRGRLAASPWLRDLAAFRDSRLAQLAVPDVLASCELKERLGTERASEQTRQLLHAFGALLEHWPRLTATAAELERRGEGLFRDLECRETGP